MVVNKISIFKTFIVILIVILLFVGINLIDDTIAYNNLTIDLKMNEIVVNVGDKINFIDYIENMSGTLNITNPVDTNKPGNGEVIFRVYDKNLKFKEEIMRVTVVRDLPKIDLVVREITVNVAETIDYYSYISNSSINLDIKINSDNVDIYNVGEYFVSYSLNYDNYVISENLIVKVI